MNSVFNGFGGYWFFYMLHISYACKYLDVAFALCILEDLLLISEKLQTSISPDQPTGLFCMIFWNQLFWKILKDYQQSVNQFESRSGLPFCWSRSGSKLFAKVISSSFQAIFWGTETVFCNLPLLHTFKMYFRLVCMMEANTVNPDKTAVWSHTGQCKRTGGCYNELVVAFYSTGGGVKGKKIYTCWLYNLFINLHLFYLWWHLAHRPPVTLQFMALPSNWWFNSWFGLQIQQSSGVLSWQVFFLV